MSNSKVITGILVGAAAGAILGILFAPDKGSETRKKIKKSGNDFKDHIKDKVNDLVDSIVEKYEGVANQIEEEIA